MTPFALFVIVLPAMVFPAIAALPADWPARIGLAVTGTAWAVVWLAATGGLRTAFPTTFAVCKPPAAQAAGGLQGARRWHAVSSYPTAVAMALMALAVALILVRSL